MRVSFAQIDLPERGLDSHGSLKIGQVVGVERDEMLRDGERFVQRGNRGGSIAKVGFIGTAEQQSHLAIGLDAVELD